MEKLKIEPVIGWLGHTHRSDNALRNFINWYRQCQTPLKNDRGHNLSIDDNQKAIGGADAFLSLFKKRDRIAAFLIVVWETLEKDFVIEFINKTKALAQKNDHRVYPILLDDLKELRYKGKDDEIWYHRELEAADIALPCHCRNQMTVIGTKRCVNLIERIMGYDIKDSKIFPDFGLKTQIAIARHINREDFNKHRPRTGAWKKYLFLSNNMPLIPKFLLI